MLSLLGHVLPTGHSCAACAVLCSYIDKLCYATVQRPALPYAVLHSTVTPVFNYRDDSDICIPTTQALGIAM